MKFAEKIRTLRVQQNKTQREAAEYCGISLRTYVSYEQDGRYPRNRAIYDKLSAFFGVDKNYLMTEDETFITQAAEQYGSSGKRQAEQLVAQLSGLFAGGELSDSDRDAVMIALQRAYFDCKKDNQKYAKKHKKGEDE